MDKNIVVLLSPSAVSNVDWRTASVLSDTVTPDLGEIVDTRVYDVEDTLSGEIVETED